VLEDDRGHGDVEHPVDLLLDDEQRRPGLVDLGQPLVDGVDHHRGQAEGDLVRHQQPGRSHQDLGQRQDALLPSREGATLLLAPRAEHGEGLEGAVEGSGHALAAAPLSEGQSEVLLDGQTGEDAPALGHVGRTGPGDLVGGQPGDVLAGQPDGARRAGQQTGDHAGHG
jgi:hypothetical protein